MKIKGIIHQDNKTHSYCPRCWSENIESYGKSGQEFYRCPDCGYDDARLISIYPQMRFEILEDKEIKHYTVGALIKWQEKYLLFHRRLFPFKYTVVAGHWDLNDETPEHAVAREIWEEAGLKLTPNSPPIIDTLYEPCRRGSDVHEWRLYQFEIETNIVTMSEEADIIGWYSPEQIKNLELTGPTNHFLKKLNII